MVVESVDTGFRRHVPYFDRSIRRTTKFNTLSIKDKLAVGVMLSPHTNDNGCTTPKIQYNKSNKDLIACLDKYLIFVRHWPAIGCLAVEVSQWSCGGRAPVVKRHRPANNLQSAKNSFNCVRNCPLLS